MMRKVISVLKRLMPLFGILFLGVASVLFLQSDFLKVKKIDCKTQYGPCNEEETGQLSTFLNQNFLFLQTPEISTAFRKDFRIRKVYVQRIFPSQLIVFLEKRKPLVALRMEGMPEKEEFLLDKEGMVVGLSESSALPLLETGERKDIVVGERADPSLVDASKLLYLTYRLGLTSDRLVGSLERGLFTISIGDTQIFYPLERNPKISAGALQLIWTKSRIDGKLPKSIDLRYSNPVLIY